MRLERFTPGEQTPIGVGKTKEVYVHPQDQEQIVAIQRAGEGIERNTPRKLKGMFYMTKLAHLLLPEHVPDVHQAGETVDGQQTIDRERAPLTKDQLSYQKQLAAGKEPRSARTNEIWGEKGPFEEEVARLGIDIRRTPEWSNYSKDSQGTLLYLSEFRPWEYTYEEPGQIELAYDEEALQTAIDQIPDVAVRTQCATYLKRVRTLFAEEQKEMNEKRAQGLLEEQAPLQMIDALLVPLEAKEHLAALFAIETEKDALSNPLRIRTMIDRKIIAEQMNTLRKHSYISKSRLAELERRYEVLKLATGSISANSPLVDHTY